MFKSHKFDSYRLFFEEMWGLLLGPPLGVLIFLAFVALIEVIFGKLNNNDLHLLLITMALGVDTHGLTPVALEMRNPDQNPKSNCTLPVSTFS